MTPEERRAKLATKSNLQMLWYAMLALQVVGIVMMVIAAVGIKTSFASIGALMVYFYVALDVVFLWAMYTLQSWLRIWLWVGVVLALLSFNLVGFVINLLEALGYMAILKAVQEPSTPSVPTAPTPPAQPQ